MRGNQSERAKINWSKIRNAVFGETVNVTENTDNKSFILNPDGYISNAKHDPLILSHGIEVVSEYDLPYAKNRIDIKDVYHNKTKNCHIVTFTDGNLCSINLENGEQNIYHCQQPIYSLAITENYHRYVALCRDNCIRILNDSFELVNVIPYSGVCCGLVYNEFTYEILTYGVGKITSWIFRNAGTLLIPRKIISENLQADDCVTCTSIEKTTSESQRCFAAVCNEVFIYVVATGDCLYHIKDSHNCLITSIMYYKPLNVLVTAANDGAVKTWTRDWNLNCLFIGHTDSVTSLAEFPYGPAIISSSTDGTVRTWSLDTKDEMHCQHVGASIFGLKCQLSDKQFFSYSKHLIHVWQVNNIHSPLSVLGAKPKVLRSSKFPLVPSLVCCICDDACARLICPISGEIVTVFISPDYTSIVDVVCVTSEALLFVLLMDGRIIKSSYKTNPCTMIVEWTKQSMEVPASVSCITLFEYHAPREEFETTEKTKNTKKDGLERKLLIGGCVDGSIVVFNWIDDKQAGKIEFCLQAHREEVICMAVNTCLNQLASASQDLTLKVWQIFPFTSEALAPLLMFVHNSRVCHLGFAHHSLGVVYQNTSESLYAFSMYKTRNIKKAREIEHSIQDDHIDVVTCLDACPKMRIFATGSLDCSIRIWSVENSLLRLLNLNDIPTSLSFCSQRGDLLVGIDTNINYISHTQYLPQNYRYRMVAMSFVDNHETPVIAMDETADKLNALDMQRLFKAHGSYMKFMTFVDDVPLEEQRRKQQEQQSKDLEFSILKTRDEELQLMKDGKLKAARKHKKTSKKLHAEAFRKYLDLFYTRPGIPYPKGNDDDVIERSGDFVTKIQSTYNPPMFTGGFFSVETNHLNLRKAKEAMRKKREEESQRRSKVLNFHDDSLSAVRETRSLSLATENVLRGIVDETACLRAHPPLSASTTYFERLRILKEKRKRFYCEDDTRQRDFSFAVEKLEKFDAESLPSVYPHNNHVTRNVNRKIVRRLEQISYDDDHLRKRDALPVAPDGYLPNSVVVALYDELRRKSEQHVPMFKPKKLNDDQLTELENYQNLEQEVEEEPHSLIMEQFSLIKEELQPVVEDITTPPLTPSPPPPPPVPVHVEPKPLKKIEKLIAPSILDEEPKESAVIVDISPPRPPTPIPDFVTQFKEEEWFMKCFPVLNSQVLGKPCTIYSFIKLLLEKIEQTNKYDIKTKIASAILLLSQQHQFDNKIKDLTRTSLLNELHLPNGKPDAKSSAVELEFVKKALQVMLEIDTISVMVFVELMTQYVVGDPLFRREILKTFLNLGLRDPKDYFHGLLVSHFIVPEEGDFGSMRKKTHGECFDWFVDSSKKFKKHITSLNGKIGRSLKSKSSFQSKRVQKHKEDKNFIKSLRTTDKNVTFLSDSFVNDAASHVSPIDVINYYCELRFDETRLDVVKEDGVVVQKVEKKEPKKTVLQNNKKDGYVSLARVGETHKSMCHPERETSLNSVRDLPSISTNYFVRSLMLHANKVTLAPFPDDMDELLYAPNDKSDLITLKYAPKYFVQSRSLMHMSL